MSPSRTPRWALQVYIGRRFWSDRKSRHWTRPFWNLQITSKLAEKGRLLHSNEEIITVFKIVTRGRWSGLSSTCCGGKLGNGFCNYYNWATVLASSKPEFRGSLQGYVRSFAFSLCDEGFELRFRLPCSLSMVHLPRCLFWPHRRA